MIGLPRVFFTPSSLSQSRSSVIVEPLSYDAETKRLAAHSGGTGVAEYCFIKLSGDTLEVWHVGRTSNSQEGYFYAFTETIPCGDDKYLHYSYGERELGKLDYNFLSKNEISEAEYDKWEEEYHLLPILERKPL